MANTIDCLLSDIDKKEKMIIHCEVKIKILNLKISILERELSNFDAEFEGRLGPEESTNIYNFCRSITDYSDQFLI